MDLTRHGVKWYLSDPQSSTDPTKEPLELDDIKVHADIACSFSDEVLASYVAAARQLCEASIPGGRRFINKTYNLVCDEFPGSDCELEIPLPPLSSVVSIGYYDASGSTQTMASSDYQVHTPANRPGYIVPRYNGTWPTTQMRDNAVTVQFVAGYGATSTSVPPAVKHAMRLICGHWFEHPNAVLTGTISKEIELGVQACLGTARWGFYG